MKILSLQIENFRNLRTQAVDFSSDNDGISDSAVSLITGRNGEGKTNLLEAVYLLAQGKSFRSSSPKDMQSWEKHPQAITSVTALIETESGQRKISYQVIDGKRKIFVNDKPVALASSFYGQLCALEFTPDDLQLVKGPPAERRRFLDSILSMTDVSYVDHLVHFQRALKNRNALLQQAARNLSRSELQAQLQPWNKVLAENGLEVAKRRKNFIAAVKPAFTIIYRSLLRDENHRNENADLRYESHFISNEEAISLELAQQLFNESFEKDAMLLKTNVGIQKDEVSFFLESAGRKKVARGIASQGQARSITLAIKLAAAQFVKDKVKEAPLLLLDDVESELDFVRKEALLEIVFGLGCQVLVSATEVSDYLKKHLPELRVFRVANGVCSPAFE